MNEFIPREPIQSEEEYNAAVGDMITWLSLITFVVLSVIVFFIALLT